MNFHVRPLGTHCFRTGHKLIPGTWCYSILISEKGQIKRQDYSAEGWEGKPEGTIAFWRVQVPESMSNPAEELSLDDLMNTFEQLDEEANPSSEQTRYVLALALLNKRRMRLEGERTEDADRYLIVSGSQSEGPFEVKDFQLSREQIDQIQAEIQHPGDS